MTVFYPYGETVTLITRTVTGRDGQGNDVYTDVPTTVANCGFDPGSSFESVTDRDQVTDSPSLYLPPGAAVPTAVSRAIVRGVTYDVDGNPLDYRSPFTGSHPGPLLRLKAVTG